jgi:hypothetical protein
MSERWKLVIKNHIKYGDWLRELVATYKGNELLWYIRTLAYWLRHPSNQQIYYPKKQRSYNRKMWHLAAEKLELKHFTIDFTVDKWFCKEHKKYCNKIKNSVEDIIYDSDHECSDFEWDDKCDPKHRILNLRHIYVVAPDCHTINTINDLKEFIGK